MPLPRYENLPEPRRRSILDAAAEEFGERGFASASYNRIIERAGISKGAMYYYFSDKDDLFRTVLEGALAEWFVKVGFPFAAHDAESFWEACVDMYQRSLRFMLADRRNAALCLEIARARQRREGHAAIVALNQRMAEWVHELVSLGRSVRAVREDIPAELAVHVALAMLDAGERWVTDHWTTIDETTVESSVRTLIDLSRGALAPKEKP